jgi:hypothetical protein
VHGVVFALFNFEKGYPAPNATATL